MSGLGARERGSGTAGQRRDVDGAGLGGVGFHGVVAAA